MIREGEPRIKMPERSKEEEFREKHPLLDIIGGKEKVLVGTVEELEQLQSECEIGAGTQEICDLLDNSYIDPDGLRKLAQKVQGQKKEIYGIIHRYEGLERYENEIITDLERLKSGFSDLLGKSERTKNLQKIFGCVVNSEERWPEDSDKSIQVHTVMVRTSDGDIKQFKLTDEEVGYHQGANRHYPADRIQAKSGINMVTFPDGELHFRTEPYHAKVDSTLAGFMQKLYFMDRARTERQKVKEYKKVKYSAFVSAGL